MPSKNTTTTQQSTLLMFKNVCKDYALLTTVVTNYDSRFVSKNLKAL